MADTITVTSPDAITLDWLVTPAAQRDPTEDLRDAVVIALGTDRLANPDDKLPVEGDSNRRGWWGDFEADATWGGWPIGTRFWLLERAKITTGTSRDGSTIARAETYTREALQPFKDKRICSQISVRAERNGTERIDVTATLFRGPLPSISLSYQSLWSGVKA